MAESVYKVVELVGTSSESWEKAAKSRTFVSDPAGEETRREMRAACG